MNNQTSNAGQWNTSQIPILGLIHGVNLIYGLGNPNNRWYDSIGGTIDYVIDYVPVQPTDKANATNVTGGPTHLSTVPYNLLNLSLSYKTYLLNRVLPGVKGAILTLSGYNILGRQYESAEGISTGYQAPTPVIFAYAGAPAQVFFSAALKF